jgi:hypothetical protein
MIIFIIILIICLVPFAIGIYKDADEGMRELNESMRQKKHA